MLTFSSMLQHYTYPVKIWMSSVLIGPLLLLFKFKTAIAAVLGYIFSLGFIQYYTVAVLIGGTCSLPCLLFLWLCYALLIRKDAPIWLTRTALAVVSLLCCVAVFIIMSLPDLKHFWSRGNMILIGAYSIPLIAGVLLYKATTSRS